MEKYLYIALFAPLVGSLFAALFAMSKKNLITGIFTSLMLAISMVASLNLLYYVYTTDKIIHVNMLNWIQVGNVNIPFGFVVDHISIVMMSVVTIVSTMVHIHSIGYMEHDKGFNRYFSYLSAFVFSMLILVMSDNFAGLFIGWEGVGLCSWLLIGFWYHKNSAAWSANEAFIMNRIADLGMLIGIFFIYWNIGSLQYDVVFSNIDSLPISLIVTIAIFLFIGAMGKSAQFPFHTWLADAMEGPTPVSALIHAATMVTAGVYLLVRTNEIYTTVPQVGYFIACLGAFVAIFAASMALVNNDMKKIIAYSTLSQLGYMFVAAGLGAYWIALFHLATHAFFKSVLFLGAGNVMHAMDNELDIRKMGALYNKMKPTAIIMIIASIALSGIFPFAGFFSKDKILEVAFNDNAIFLWGILFITAGLTAFYSFRLIMKIFFTKPNYEEYGYHPHETYPFVIASMIPLALLSIIAGWFEPLFVRLVSYLLPKWEASRISHSNEYILIALTSAIAISGILFAVYKYNKGGFCKTWEETFSYKLLTNQYFIPWFYDKIICKTYFLLSKFAFKVIDMKIIDVIVDLIAKFIYKTGENSVVIQSGNLSQSLKVMTMGVAFIIILIASVAFFK
ncbi:NADH-quinone oxidoreductase subunit L [Malaciobacter molluscorum LMG 25693]|uniref:NADH-quinone oxidoreductase subunit L n=1 Tax=Malaciobacter molluscorum LMG 25693 TaxID=870501 RepID=A0A2G1DFL7_9BACT|nr:NADH-quinone oxidoreductase subunit L [Malaciobacter molluscorum]AXX93573.1 NADH:quinone oxidoreductase I, membrane subunit L [Malaciobacter molluscorum LMG 25693]PHO17273.1 NADH-quinone oxidoreductase subunit L [Malaciobacter molluscorum LMG 25693]RXJ93867.1 NADH-quinone oxidoreductase subunit L [Malaciobacter molluscorum]